MEPNWNILKQKFDYMIDTSGENISYITVGTQTYDDDTGLIFFGIIDKDIKKNLSGTQVYQYNAYTLQLMDCFYHSI